METDSVRKINRAIPFKAEQKKILKNVSEFYHQPKISNKLLNLFRKCASQGTLAS